MSVSARALNLSVAFSLLGTTALTQEAFELDEIFIEADNRIETPVSEATRSVTVVTQEEIDEQSTVSETVADILANTTPGFSPSNEALTSFGQTLRGRKFLVLIDGISQSTPLRDADRSLNTIDPASIERIEVVRGGNAAYGFGATGGTVNIVTKRPVDGERRSFLTTTLGFSGTELDDSLDYGLQFGTSGRNGALDYLLDVSAGYTSSFFDADGERISSNQFGVQGSVAESSTFSLVGKVGYEIDGVQRLQFSINRFRNEQDPKFAGVGVGDRANDVRTPAVEGNISTVNPGTENTTVNLDYTHEDVAGSSVKAQLYFTALEITFAKSPEFIADLQGLGINTFFPQTQVASTKTGARLTVNTPLGTIGSSNEESSLTWGLDYLRDNTRPTDIDFDELAGDLNAALGGFGVNIDPDSQTTPELTQNALAVFAQLEAPVTEKFTISAGVRHERISVDVEDYDFLNVDLATFAIGIIPTAGGTLEYDETLFNVTASYDVTDQMTVYGGFSQGFTITELGRVLRENRFVPITDAETEAERTDNYELGLRYAGSRWDGSVVGFVSESDNGVTFDPTTLDVRLQPERIWGVEATANFDINQNLRVGGTWTHIRGQVDTDDDGDYDFDLDATRVSPNKFTAYAEFSPMEGWEARIQGLYSAGRRYDTQDGTQDIESYFVVDAYNNFDIGFGELSVGVKNLLNRDYTTVLGQTTTSDSNFNRAPGRSVSVAYKVEF